VAVEARGFGGKFLLADESLQIGAEFGLVRLRHTAADADG